MAIDKSKLTIADLEKDFMTVSEFQKAVLPNSPYQYARQMIIQNTYGLEIVEVNVGDEDKPRRYVSKASVAKCITIRAQRAEERKAKAK